MSNVSVDQALVIFDDKAAQQRFLEAQSARFVKRVDAAPSETGGAAAAARAVQDRDVSILDVRVLQAQMLIQSGNMKPYKALETMIGKRIGEGHDDAQAVYFAYQVLSTLGVFLDTYKQELLDQVKVAHVNYNAVDEAIAAAGSTLERELEAVETLYDLCAPVDWKKKFPEKYTKDSVWNSLFGPFQTDGKVNQACIEGILYYYGCLPSGIPTDRRQFMTQHYVLACKQVDDVAADKACTGIAIGYSQLMITPPHLDQCPHVTSFGIAHSPLTRLPKSVYALTSLERFLFPKCHLTELPDLSRFPKLEQVNVKGNKLKSLPDLRKNMSLTSLDASDNKLTGPLHLPTSLEDLELVNNYRLNFSDFSNLSVLKSLNVDATGLQEFPSLPAENALEILLVASNAISQLPASLAHLSHLETLDVSGNPLTDVSTITQLTALKNLDVAGTGLTELPDLSVLLSLKKVKIGDKHKLDGDTMTMLEGLTGVKIQKGL